MHGSISPFPIQSCGILGEPEAKLYLLCTPRCSSLPCLISFALRLENLLRASLSIWTLTLHFSWYDEAFLVLFLYRFSLLFRSLTLCLLIGPRLAKWAHAARDFVFGFRQTSAGVNVIRGGNCTVGTINWHRCSFYPLTHRFEKWSHKLGKLVQISLNWQFGQNYATLAAGLGGVFRFLCFCKFAFIPVEAAWYPTRAPVLPKP